MYSICVKKYGYIPVAKTSNNFSIPHYHHSNSILHFSSEYDSLSGNKNAIYHISLMKPEVIPYYVGTCERYRKLGKCKIIFNDKGYREFINFLESISRYDIILKMETWQQKT